ncbi:MAG: sugar transferase [Candidatus Acidoferrum typicum]|nr:sugar transferase [Candidatus Acidoferrum typicum]
MFSPILLAIGLAVFLENGLPILFLQTRVGRNGQLFRMVKIRTMRSGANGSGITISGDCRVTRVGRVLRKFKLDELPQLWNVVRGQMSLVGPRPEVPEFVDLSEPVWRSVLRVRPGITDPVSVAYRDEEKLLAKANDAVRFYREIVLPDKLARTLGYLENRSLWGDVLVIVQTIRCAAFPQQFESKRAETIRLGDPR